MIERKIKKIFNENHLVANSIKKINIGFTNEVYPIDDEYILKICKNKSNENNFKKEAYFMGLFNDKIKIPKIIMYDDSKKIINKNFLIYKKIIGDNLYSKWHLLNDNQRKEIIKELCDTLKIINNIPYDDFAKRFEIKLPINWKKSILEDIKNNLEKIKFRNIIPKSFIKEINDFIEKNNQALNNQRLGLVYWDVHFDNLLINNEKLVGILDLERIELMSIDYVLSLVRRMINYPKIYVSEEFEKYVKKEDYSNIFEWYKEFYPELFEFNNLDKRLDIYDLDYDLELLLDFPKSKDLKNRIKSTIKLKGGPKK